MSTAAIAKVLIGKGMQVFRRPREPVPFTQNPEADAMLNDLDRFPHGFVLGCVMDRQVKSERAWLIPYVFSQKLGTIRFSRFAQLSLPEVRGLMTKPQSLHRFPAEMSKNFHAAVGVIAEKYSGDAARMWRDKPSSAELVSRFMDFRGVGPKLATMGTNILARDFKIPLSDYYSIDVSVDVQVRRVLSRLGLIRQTDSFERVIFRARALNPEFPGLLDYPAWEVGRNWCRPKAPLCGQCYLQQVCPSARIDG